MTRWRWWGIAAASLAALAGLLLLWGWLARGPAHEVLVPEHPVVAEGKPRALTVVTVNLAHGRGEGFHQALLGRAEIEANLEAVANALRHPPPDVVAVQEADGPSLWSGRFDHVAYLAERLGLKPLRGDHVRAPGTRYGTGFMLGPQPSAAWSATFEPALPGGFAKGYVVATVYWPGFDRPLDLVSVHLDFARASTRASQVETLIADLAARDHLRMVAGDFNTDWVSEPEVLPRLAAALDLHSWRPDETTETFPGTSGRLDWILASRALHFESYEVLTAPISDHRAVRAVLTLANPATLPP